MSYSLHMSLNVLFLFKIYYKVWETVLAMGTLAKGTAAPHRPPGGWEGSGARQDLHCLNQQGKGGGRKGEGRRNRAPEDFGEAECPWLSFLSRMQLSLSAHCHPRVSVSGFFPGRGG